MIRFSSFMQEWLYGENGYYSTFKSIGKEGDFYTAVSATPFFGGAIAKRILSVIDEGFLSKNCTILEIGAHKGYLLADIIQFIYTFDPKLTKTLKFAIYEPQKEILSHQKEYLKSSFGDRIDISYFSDFKELNFKNAFIVANEIFDAFSCEVVKDGKMLYMDRLEPFFGDLTKEIEEITKEYDIKKGEVALGYKAFGENLSKYIKKFEFVTFDYGEESQREDFSLRVYDKHRVFPFFSLTKFAKDEDLKKREITLEKLYKKSDITYDVNFSFLKGEFKKSGIKRVEFMTQLKAMVAFGITDLFEILRKNVTEEIYLKELNRAKVLLDPSFMGERLKCAIFRKY